MDFEAITISAQVAAAPETVWQRWTAPEHITQWNFASDGWCCPSAANELTVGGRYKARMEAKDGSFGFDFEAVYDLVEPGRALAYTMTDGRRAETRFEPVDGGTRVTTRFDAESENPLDMQRDGWQAILNNFKAYAERA